MNDSSEEGFLDRWSRRKRSGDEPTEDEAATMQPDPEDPDAQALEQARQLQLAANREAAEAVDIEAITYESDLSVFFKEGVPALLKQAAMRKMWRSDPVFANVDGLNDYDQDFNVIDKVLTEFKSAWQVGQGYRVPEDLEPTAEGDPNEADDAVAEADAPDGEGAVSNASEEGAEADTDQIADRGRDEGPPAADYFEAGPVPDREIPTGRETDNGDDRGPQSAEEVRPSVSLRRRMAFFEDDPKA